MIPNAHLVAWRATVPWPDDAQVEQDLVISRALVEIFQNPFLKAELAFRGGTALHKLFITPAGRYSEDIDLVQVHQEPIGETIDRLRSVLDSWLGKPKRKFGDGRATLVYSFETTSKPTRTMKVKIEINTREHGAFLGFTEQIFEVKNDWFRGSALIKTFKLEELLATKLRALYQRKKGRDLFDLWITSKLDYDLSDLIKVFRFYMKREGNAVSAVEFKKNIEEKLNSSRFLSDIDNLLPLGQSYDRAEATKITGQIINALE